MKKIFLTLFSLLIFISMATATSLYTISLNGVNLTNTPVASNWYVTQNGAGSKNGTSQGNAWAITNVGWLSVNPYDNVYICGTIYTTSTFDIQKSGVAGFPLTIRGDCPGSPGIIDGAPLLTGSWTSVGNNIYATTPNNIIDPTTTHYGLIVEDQVPLAAIPWNTNIATTTPAMLTSNVNSIGFSTTSNSITTGTLNFTVSTGLSILIGIPIVLIPSSNQNDSLTGTVSSYNSSTGALVVDITTAVGTGTGTLWKISIGGGTYTYDPINNILYVLSEGSDNPSGHVMQETWNTTQFSGIGGSTNKSNLVFENMTWRNSGAYGLTIENGSNITLNNVTVYNTSNWGMFLQLITNLIVENGTYYNLCELAHPPSISELVGEGVRFYSVSGGSFNNNILHDSQSIGLDLYGNATVGFGPTSGISVYNNTITNGGQGIYSDYAHNNFIYNNVLLNTGNGNGFGAGGIILSSETSGQVTSGTYVYNNLVSNMGFAATFGVGTSHIVSENNFVYNNTFVNLDNRGNANFSGSMNDTIQNNIFYGITQLDTTLSTYAPGYHNYNTYIGTFINYSLGSPLTFTQWQTDINGDANSQQTNSASLSSLFVNAPSDFDLVSNVLTVNAGTNLNSIFAPLALDYAGNPRPAVSTNSYDTGALNTPGL